MRLLDVLKPSTEYLEKSGIDEPLIEAETLILHAAMIERLTAYRDNPEIGQDFLTEIHKLLDLRAKGEPLQYIIGYVDFLDLKIKVGRGVLIPRPETELLTQEAIIEGRRQKNSSLTILDLCTGSGCISLCLAREFPDADIYGSDISEAAIKYAEINAKINEIKNIAFLRGSLFKPIKEPLTFDLIISNPPYIRTSDIDKLQREIKEWEPLEALDGGADGLDFYRKIFSGAERYLKKNGKIILEVAFDQAEAVTEIAEDSDFTNITIIKDYAGIKRILKAEK